MAKKRRAKDTPKTKVIYLGPPDGVTDLFFLIETPDGERTWMNYGVEDLLAEEESGHPATMEQLLQVLDKHGINELEMIQAVVTKRQVGRRGA